MLACQSSWAFPKVYYVPDGLGVKDKPDVKIVDRKKQFDQSLITPALFKNDQRLTELTQDLSIVHFGHSHSSGRIKS